MKKLLDHGYLTLVEGWGSDERIVEAARMSTGKGFLGWGPTTRCQACGVEKAGEEPHPYQTAVQLDCAHQFETKPGDEKLLRYLYEHKHLTPFEMAGLIIEVQAPIMVFREWHRHRTQFYNEMSARYTPLPDLNYIPTVERLLLNSKTNKQAGTIKGAAELTPAGAEQFRTDLGAMYEAQEGLYQVALTSGVPKELARVHLPVGRYSRMRAGASLRNWLAFLTLRMDPAAQWEIRQYSIAVAELVQERFPRTYALFLEGRR